METVFGESRMPGFPGATGGGKCKTGKPENNPQQLKTKTRK